MKFFLVALITAASHLVYAQEAQAPKTIIIQVGNPAGATAPQKLQFSPRVVAVNPGDTVTYVSNGAHRVREQANFTLCSPSGDGGFDSGPLPQGATWTVPAAQLVPGKTIFYYCPEGNGTHCPSPNNMQGALVVRPAAGGAAPGATADAPGGASGGTAPKTVTVEVGKGGTKFVPDNVSVSPGDTVMFKWVGGNHNVVPSDAPASCERSAKIDTDPIMKLLASGPPQTTGQHAFVVPATARVGGSLNYFCAVATHCSAGKMYATINIVAPGAAGPAAAPTTPGGAATATPDGGAATTPESEPEPTAASATSVRASVIPLVAMFVARMMT